MAKKQTVQPTYAIRFDDIPAPIRESITAGKFFKVTFEKRTTGEIREMWCRTGVKAHLKGGDAAYNFSEKNLIPVFDTAKEEYRSIPVEKIIEIRAGNYIWNRRDLVRKNKP